MKQTKHLKRTALPLSAKSMLGTLLLLIAMLMPQWTWAAGYDPDGYYKIERPHEFLSCIKTHTFVRGIKVRFYSDIQLTAPLEGIFGDQQQSLVNVTIDGNGHTISGVNLTAQYSKYGLFGNVESTTIRNLKVEGTMTTGIDNCENLGLVGFANGNSVIENVTCNMNIIVNNTGCKHIGGIVGCMAGTTKVKNCTYNGTITLNQNTEQVGGIVGFAQNDLSITDNIFSGTITSTGTCKYIAGIAGKTDGTIDILGCTSTGTINAGTSYDCVAGIVGYVNYQSRALINYCYFGGSISSTSSSKDLVMGGILGSVNDDNGGNFRGINYCYSNGTITANNAASEAKIGGIAGAVKNKATQVVKNNTYEGSTAALVSGSTNYSLDTSNKAISISLLSNNNTYGTVRQTYIKPTSTTATKLQAEAVPNSGCHFHKWNDGLTEPQIFGLTQDINLTANFGSWGKGAWEWEGYSATCTCTCTYDANHKSSKTVTLGNGIEQELINNPTCTTNGTNRYTAKATVEGTDYSDIKDFDDIVPIGHDYNNIGVCTHDPSHYQPATLSAGYYQIANYGNLCWFRNEVNSGKTINAKLTADINLSGNSWATSIGEGKEFAGTFDGQGHTITGNASKALFCVLKAGSTVKNVVSSGATSKDNYDASGNSYQSPFVRRNYGTIENCIVKSAYWDSRNSYLGGITGVNETGGIVRNCGFYDSTLRLRNGANTQVGGIVGVNCANGRIENCFTWGINYYNIGSLGSGGIVCENRSGAIVSNCYTNVATPVFKQEGTATDLTSGITAAFITTGEMCYKLNAGTTNGSQVWYQKIGTETYPTSVVKNTANTVYKIEHLKCDGSTPNGNVIYTNNGSMAPSVDVHGLEDYTASYAWEGTHDAPTCKFTLTCKVCEEEIVKSQPITTTAGTYGSFSVTTTPAKCTEKGVVTCQAAGKYTDPNGKNAPYTESTTSNDTNTTTYAIAAFGHGHKGYTPSYAWIGTADDPTCTFTLFCEECKTNVVNEVLTTDAAAANGFYAQTAHVDEGCTDAGYTTYAATGKYPATSPSVAYTEQTPNVKTYGITAHGHDYADAVWTWADDGHSATCSRTCEYCGDEQKADVNLEGGISSEETQHATCTTKGVHTYTATATVKDKTYTDVKEVDDIEALDHLFGEGSWEWANNESDCAAFCTVVCEREGCGARMSNSAIFGRGLTAEVTTPPTCTTKGVHTYTAIAVMPGAKRTDVREFEDIPALGHGHQGYTSSYDWTGTAADPICKFRLFCEACQTAVVDEELILGLEAAGGYYTQTDHHDATCTDRGFTTYAAMGQYDAEAPSVVYTEEHPDIHTYEISALGHNYADAVWTWADDGHSATCSLTCSVCDDELHTDVTLEGGITSEVVTPATCTAAGSTLYSAIATVKGEDYISTKRVDGDVAALPHTFADNDTRHELCTVCHHTLFHYTSSKANSPVRIISSNKNYDADDNVLKVVSNTCDADRHGVIEYDGTLVRIGQYGFSGSLFAGTLVIPSTVTTIDQFAFTGDDTFTSVEFGPNLTTIGQFAFSDCSGLTGTIVIPDAVTSVGLSAFYNCNINNLVARCQLDLSSCGVYEYQITRTHEFTEESRTHQAQAATCQKDATYYITCANCHKPGTETWTDEDSKSAHTFADDDTRHELCTTCGHTLFHYTFEPGMLPMIFPGPSARFLDPEGNSLEIVSFLNPDDIDSGESYMEFDGELATIGESAFLHSMFDGTYIIPSTVTTIGDAAFANNRNVKGIELGSSVTTIGIGAFADCSSITGPLTIPASVTEMGYNAFSGCRNVETFVVSCTSPLTTEDLRDAIIPDEKLEIRHADDSEKTLISAATCRNDAVYHLVCSACGIDDNITEPHTATGLHTFADDDINHELCTTCGMSFAHTIFYYTVEPGADPVLPRENSLLDAVGNPLTIVSNTVDEEGNGIMEFDGPLVTIGEAAFSGAPLIGTLTIPASVTTIGEHAFEICDHLTGLELGASVTTIGNFAFNNCYDLTDLELGASVTTIGNFAFKYCSGLTGTLTIPDAVTTIGDGAFFNCSGLTGLELGASVTTIGKSAFESCSGLTGTLTIPDAVTTIGVCAFAYCENLTGLELGASVTTIGESAFESCSGLTGTLTIPDAVATIGVAAFSDCYGLTDLELGASVTTIGNYAFKYCSGLTGTLTIPDAVTTIGDGAFFNCSGLTGLKLGAAVTTIGAYAFYDCEYLAGDVKLPATVTTIGEKAFSYCDRVKSFYVLCTSPFTQDDLDIAGIEEEKVVHYHADESNMTLVQASTCTTDAIYHIVCGACGVEEDALVLGTATGHTFAADDINHELCTTCGMSFAHTIFYYTVEPGADPVLPQENSLLDDVANPLAIVNNTVDEEGNGIMEFDGPLVTIGENAFSGAPFIGSLTIPASVTTIGEHAFEACDHLTDLKLGASVTTIGNFAFANCTSLTGTLTIPDAVTTIGEDAFFNCRYLSGNVKLPATVTTIGNNAFFNCDRVKSFYVLCTSPLTQDDLDIAGIEEKKVAHYHADESNMTLVQAPTCATDAIYHIVCGACGVEEDAPVLGTATGLHTFADDDINHELCTTCGMSFAHTIFHYTVEPGADPVDPYSPENLLDAVGNPLTIVSNTVDEEGNGVMEFDGTLVTIGESAFEYCDGLIGSLTIPSTVTTIGDYAFYGCSGLTGTLTIPDAVTTVGEGAFWYADFENCLTPCTLDLEYSGLNPEIITYLHHYDEHAYCSICGQFDMPSEPSIGTLVRFIDFLHQPEAETAGYSTSYVKDIAARILGHETAVWNPEKMLKTNIKNRTGAVNIETNVKQLPTAESQDVQMLDDEGLLWAVLDNNADLHIVTSMPKIKMKSCHGLFSNISTTDYIYGLEHLDLEDVTDMSDMFAGCNALREVDLYDLYAPNVTNTSRMFYGCERIEYINLEGCLTMTGVTEKADMFTGCGTKATDSDGDPCVTFVNVEWSPEEITATTEGTGWDDNYMIINCPE